MVEMFLQEPVLDTLFAGLLVGDDVVRDPLLDEVHVAVLQPGVYGDPGTVMLLLFVEKMWMKTYLDILTPLPGQYLGWAASTLVLSLTTSSTSASAVNRHSWEDSRVERRV